LVFINSTKKPPKRIGGKSLILRASGEPQPNSLPKGSPYRTMLCPEFVEGLEPVY